jgi:signal transduction histidine kinase/CheY-like chemotaxis protein
MSELPEDPESLMSLQRFVGSLGAVCFVIGYDRGPRWIAPGWARIYGGDPARLAADPRVLFDGVHPDSADRAAAFGREIEERVATGADGLAPMRRELLHRLVDGTYRWTEFTCNIVRADDGARYLTGVLTDATRTHEAAVRLAAATRREADANRSTAEFVSKMSHELRTPLHAILGYAQLLEMGAGNPADYLSRLRRAGDHLVHLLDDLLDFSRLNADRLTVSDDVVDLGLAIDGAVEMLAAQALARDIAIERSVESPLWVRADATRLRQVVTNLVSNAIKYNVDGGSVSVSATLSNDDVVVAITDTGPGLSAEVLPRLFVPFDRLGAEGSGVSGVGLGLPLTDGLVRAMGGSIEVASVLGSGTTFRVRLRAAGRGDDQPTARDIVCIDDDAESRRILDAVLQLMPGARVALASTGSSGLAMIDRLQPSLVVLDRHLPGYDADALLAAVALAAPDCPVVMVSSDPAVLRPEFLRPPLVAAFAKPLDLDVFVDAVDRIWSMRET